MYEKIWYTDLRKIGNAKYETNTTKTKISFIENQFFTFNKMKILKM